MTQACRDSLRMDDIDLKKSSHTGQLLNFFLQDYKKDETNKKDDARKNLLDTAKQAPIAAKEVYQHAFNLFKKSLPEDCVNAQVKFKGRGIIGLGIESPLETGLALHHTYGVPYIPGSALKGLASHYCDQVWGEKNPDYKLKARYHRVLFGTTDESGYIVFNDGWISPESLDSCLECDVMTIHHPKYYRSEDSPPSDYDSPTPITFLSINDKCTFQLFLYCDSPGDEGKKWAELAMKLLLEALENWGIGAKTNSGYGRMKKAEDS